MYLYDSMALAYSCMCALCVVVSKYATGADLDTGRVHGIDKFPCDNDGAIRCEHWFDEQQAQNDTRLPRARVDYDGRSKNSRLLVDVSFWVLPTGLVGRHLTR